MRGPDAVYSGSTATFVQDATQNRIEGILTAEFERSFRRRPSGSERHSWGNSLVRAKDAIVAAKLRDNGVILEYQLPLTSRRLDCLLTGHDADGRARAEVIELKQWESCEEAPEPNEVVTVIAGGPRVVLHPSVQVAGYEQYLRDMHTAFYEAGAIQLGSCGTSTTSAARMLEPWWPQSSAPSQMITRSSLAKTSNPSFPTCTDACRRGGGCLSSNESRTRRFGRA